MADISKINVNNTTYNLKDSRIPPLSNDTSVFLRGDGTWGAPSTEEIMIYGDVEDQTTGMLIDHSVGAQAIGIQDIEDGNGGTHRIITAISLADDTVVAEALLEGYTAHNAYGWPITGTLVPGVGSLQMVTHVAPTESSQTIIPDEGYDGLSSVQIDAVPSSYVGSTVARRSSTNLTVSGATVTAPSGYYASNATATVASGSATTPATTITANPTIGIDIYGLITATTSATSNVTPTVTAGYVSSGTAGTITVSGTNTAQMSTKLPATITPTKSSQLAVGSHVYTLGSVYVGPIPDNYIEPSGTKSITQNGTGIDVTEYASVDVSVPSQAPRLQAKSASPTESEQTIMPDSGYDGLSGVTIDPISSTYVGSEIPRKNATHLTVTNATVTVPSGYYASNVSTTIASGSVAVPDTAITVSCTPSLNTSTGLITSTVSKTQDVSPTVTAGYVSSGEDGTITVSGSGTLQLSTQAGTTITPTESQQTAVAANKYTLGAVNVAAISSTYVGSGITQRTSDDLTVSGSQVSVPAGYYASAASKTVSSMVLPTAAVASATNGFTAKAAIAPSTSPQYLNIPSGYNATASYYTISPMTAMTLPTATSSSITSGSTLKATINRSTSVQYLNIPAGYNSEAAHYTISATANGSATAPASISGTSATVNINNGTVTLSKTVSVTPTVTEGYVSSGTAGNSSVSLSGAITMMTLPTAAVTAAPTSSTLKATIDRSTSAQYIAIPAGYNSVAAYYTITATPNGSVTAPSTISGTSSTVSVNNGTVTLTKTVSVTPNVTTSGYITSGTAGNSAITLSGAMTTQAAATYYPSASDQTISASRYLSGAQTFKAVEVSNLAAANVKAGTTIKVGDSADDDRIMSVTGTFTSDANATAGDIISGQTAYVNGSKVTGTLVIQHYYTGTGTPSSSTGVNGDIYVRT